MAPYCSWTAQGSYNCAQTYEDYEGYGDYVYEGFANTPAKKVVPAPQNCISAKVFNRANYQIGETLQTPVPFHGLADKKGFVKMLSGGDFNKIEIRNIPCAQIKSLQTVPKVVPKAPAPAPKPVTKVAPPTAPKTVVKAAPPPAPGQATLANLLTNKTTNPRVNIRSVGAGTCLQGASFGVGACPATPALTVTKAASGKGFTIKGPNGNYFNAADGRIGVYGVYYSDQDWTFVKDPKQNAFQIKSAITQKCLKATRGSNALSVAPCNMADSLQLWQ